MGIRQHKALNPEHLAIGMTPAHEKTLLWLCLHQGHGREQQALQLVG